MTVELARVQGLLKCDETGLWEAGEGECSRRGHATGRPWERTPVKCCFGTRDTKLGPFKGYFTAYGLSLPGKTQF